MNLGELAVLRSGEGILHREKSVPGPGMMAVESWKKKLAAESTNQA